MLFLISSTFIKAGYTRPWGPSVSNKSYECALSVRAGVSSGSLPAFLGKLTEIPTGEGWEPARDYVARNLCPGNEIGISRYCT